MDNESPRAREKRCVLSVSRMTIHNGPGFRTLILFKGCPLHCVWCSTPESQKRQPEIALNPKNCIHCEVCLPACPLHAITLTADAIEIDRDLCNICGACVKVCYPEAIKILGKYMTVNELLEEARKDNVFFKHTGGGITISGGEPLLDPEFTTALLQGCNKEGISVGVDTCGHVPWNWFERILQYVDFFLWDIKHMDPAKHLELTGVSNRLILRNCLSASNSGTPIYIRIPVIPGHNDGEGNIRATCEFARALPSLVEVNLMPVHHLGRARYQALDRPYLIDQVQLISDGAMEGLKMLVESYGLRCRIVS